MSFVTKFCRVCGAEYEACKTPNTENVFRWRDVACSKECGAEYLKRVLASRSGVNEREVEDIQDIPEMDDGFELEEESDDEESEDYTSEFGE